jgi:hypothetical protein
VRRISVADLRGVIAAADLGAREEGARILLHSPVGSYAKNLDLLDTL